MPACFGCVDRCLCIGKREGEGLLHEHRLARGGGAPDLLRMQAVRRGEHDCIDRRITQDRVQIVGPMQTMLATEISHRRRGAGMRLGEAKCLAVPRGLDEIPAPPAEANDGRAYHSANSIAVSSFGMLSIG